MLKRMKTKVVFNKDSFYVSQLKEGYMLRYLGDDKFRVEKTGYPYPDTPLPSQKMADILLEWLGVFEEISVADLASIFSTIYCTESYDFNKDALRRVIVNKSVGAAGEFDDFSVFFECKFYSIYYIPNAGESKAFKYMLDNDMHCVSYRTDGSVFVLHFHKRIQHIQLGKGVPAESIEAYKDFKKQFKLVNYMTTVEMKRYLDALYDKLSLIKIPMKALNPYLSDESLFCIPHQNNPRSIQYVFDNINYNLWNKLGLRDLFFKSESLKSSPVKTVLEEIFGFNVFYDLDDEHGLFNNQLSCNISMYCCLYLHTSVVEEKVEYSWRISSIVHQIISIVGSGKSCKYSAGVVDGNVNLLASPYLWLYYQNRMFPAVAEGVLKPQILFGGTADNKQLLKSDKYGVRYAVNLGNYIRDLVSPFENKLYQYFLVYKLSILTNFETLEGGHTKFSYRNVLKTFIPNFDKKVLMGEIFETDFMELIGTHYGVSVPDNYNSDCLPSILDNALDEVDYFTEEEKDFIWFLTAFYRSASGNRSTKALRVAIYDMGTDPKSVTAYIPQFDENFLRIMEPVLKMFTLVFTCNNLEYARTMLEKFDFRYEYKDGSFLMVFEKKGE